MPEITTARVALALSIIVALWNLLKHLLEGGRVRVKLRSGLQNDSWLADADSWSKMAVHHSERNGWNIEVALISVENIGRTAVTVSKVGLEYKSGPWWSRRKPISVVPFARKAQDAQTESTFRLEPFDKATWVYDAWVGLDNDNTRLGRPARPLSIRASVSVAGKRWVRRSSWRHRWHVAEGQRAFLPVDAEFDHLVYRYLSRHAAGDKWAEIAVIPSVIDIRKKFPQSGSAPTTEELSEIIESHYHSEPKAAAGLIGFYLHEAIVSLYEDGDTDATGEAVSGEIAPADVNGSRSQSQTD